MGVFTSLTGWQTASAAGSASAAATTRHRAAALLHRRAPQRAQQRRRRHAQLLRPARASAGSGDDDDAPPILGDWRSFRAKLMADSGALGCLPGVRCEDGGIAEPLPRHPRCECCPP